MNLHAIPSKLQWIPMPGRPKGFPVNFVTVYPADYKHSASEITRLQACRTEGLENIKFVMDNIKECDRPITLALLAQEGKDLIVGCSFVDRDGKARVFTHDKVNSHNKIVIGNLEEELEKQAMQVINQFRPRRSHGKMVSGLVFLLGVGVAAGAGLEVLRERGTFRNIIPDLR